MKLYEKVNEILGTQYTKDKDVPWEKLARDKEFMVKFDKHLDWFKVSRQTLSETFIHVFQDKLKWDRISQYQILSEDFIRLHQDKIWWGIISRYQNLGGEFICEFSDRLAWDYLCKFKRLEPWVMIRCIEKIKPNLSYLYTNKKISVRDLMEIEDYVNLDWEKIWKKKEHEKL